MWFYDTCSCLSTVCSQELLNPPLECQGKNERGKVHTCNPSSLFSATFILKKRENLYIILCFILFSVPKIRTILNEETNQMELQFEGRNKTRSSMCVQYEEKGICRVSTL